MRVRSRFCLLLGLLGASLGPGPVLAEDIQRLNLWPVERLTPPADAKPEGVHRPDLAVYLPETPTGVGVIILPGGGYGGLSYEKEGVQIARWLNQHGIAGFIVKYRCRTYRHPVPLQDAQRATRIVLSKAKEYDIDPKKLGVIGFSAGGHLASSLCTEAGQTLDYDAVDAADATPVRLAFACLLYPVISMRDGVTHGGSRRNLLGTEPDPTLLDLMSTDERVTKLTPPTLLIHCVTDQAVPLENSQRYLAGLRGKDIPGKLVTYNRGRHGSGLLLTGVPDADWAEDDFLPWLKRRGLLSP